ncbi:hypothetical protein, partial [Proteus terrae]|uniref:hypothetical protein n=1 Tax=Proteus terrae TaxID=1574161 RepID=UPI00301C9609
YDLALSRFLNLEKRFLKDENYAKSYKDNINSVINKKYAELCTDSYKSGLITWYLPHFGVVLPHKRKLRVVYDAAAKVRGMSLNSLLFPGP